MIHCAIVKDVFDFKIKVLLVWADCTEKFHNVIGVQGAGLSRKTAGKIRVTNMSHALEQNKYSK